MPGGLCIRNKSSGLVLDSSQRVVTVQYYNGSSSQFWDLQNSIIRSNQNGYCLDIEGGCNEGSAVITHPANGGTNQQWYLNSDGTISSEAGHLVLDIKGGDIHAGAELCAFRRTGGQNQQFELITMRR